MQQYHVDPARDSDWLWGAIDPNHTHTAIADSSGIPAFAICATEVACDLISPQADITPTPPPSRSGASSVLFLPGIKGSSLYKKSIVCPILSALCDIPLWLPLSNLSIPDLFLTADGSSKEDVYAKDEDILSHAYGSSFYDAFSKAMNAYAERTGASWKPIAYDWRRSLSDIVRNGNSEGGRISYAHASETLYLKEELKKLASSSPSGKVTIITHSNGGLVAKKLMEELGSSEAAQLIDAVILIGVPQSGAPRALASLLFGEGESLPATGALAELIMSAANARAFGLFAPMAYHLLPSKAYFDNVEDPTHPVLSFGEGTLLSLARTLFGPSIDSLTELRDYALGRDGRTAPAKDDLQAPGVLRENLLEYATSEHSALDAWVPPAGIAVYQIAGWGADTLSGLQMYEYAHNGIAKILYRPQFVEDGDGTVPIPSALLMTTNERVKRYWIDLPGIAAASAWYSHGNLLEIPQVGELIENILSYKSALPEYIYTAQPETLNPQKKLLFVLHTEASVRVFDSSRHSSGITSKGASVNEIPGSQSGVIGALRYVLVPGDAPYTLEIEDAEPNSIILDIQELLAGEVSASSTIAVPEEALRLTLREGIEYITYLPSEEKILKPAKSAHKSSPEEGAEKGVPEILDLPEPSPSKQERDTQAPQTLLAREPKGFTVIAPTPDEPSLDEAIQRNQTMMERLCEYIRIALKKLSEWWRAHITHLSN